MTKRLGMTCAALLAGVLSACGGTPSKETNSAGTHTDEEMKAEPAGPAEWDDWKSYNNVSPGPWMSPTHGKRFVEIYVNDIALEAYKSGGDLPVGSIVVKPSWENEGGKPGADGPLFVMVKKEAGYAPDNGDWYYAFQWPNPPEKWAAKLGPDRDWRSPSGKVEYCLDCHDTLDRQLGMPPKERQDAW